MSKLYLIILPIAFYAAYLGIAAIRKTFPSRRQLNMHTSLLLMFYLLATSGLGIFWVAHQQLPVFDWHYLFGYGTLLLVGIHLFFNVPPLVRTLKKRRPKEGAPTRSKPRRKRTGVGVMLLCVLCGLSFYLGTLFGENDIDISWTDTRELPMGPVDAVVDYHTFSAESSADLFKRSPGIEWTGENAEFKEYAGRTVSLPEPGRGGRPLGAAVRGLTDTVVPLSLEVMSTVLFHGAGVTEIDGGYNLRAAPSSGALAPTEVYVHTDGLPGLEAGVYYYHPLAHHLVQIPSDGTVDGTHVYITSVFQRTGQKYEDRAYRYAAADAGHIIENLRIAAAEYGHAAQPLPYFDELEIQDAIGLDGIQEGVLADIKLGSHWTSLPSGRWSFLGPPDDKGLGVTGIVQHATSLRRVRASGEALPAPTTHSMGAFETIRKRRSRRRFSKDALSLNDLSALLSATQGPGQLLSRSIVLRVVVDRVDGLQPGVYRYLPETHALQKERSGAFMKDAYETTFSQDAVGEGAVAFVFSTDRRLLFSDHGARGYRHAFLETGMQSERILLEAVGLGLSACPVGAFFDDDAARLVGTDMEQEWVLHFIGLGRPSSD